MNPEQLAFEERLDDFNRMARAQKVPMPTRYRAREYIREARFHHNFVKHRELCESLGISLQGAISNHMASHYLGPVWYFRRTSMAFRQSVASHLAPQFFEKR